MKKIKDVVSLHPPKDPKHYYYRLVFADGTTDFLYIYERHLFVPVNSDMEYGKTAIILTYDFEQDQLNVFGVRKALESFGAKLVA